MSFRWGCLVSIGAPERVRGVHLLSEQVASTDLSQRLRAQVAQIDEALRARWWEARLPGEFEESFTQTSDRADRSAFRLWLSCLVGLHMFGLVRDATFGVPELGYVLRLAMAVPLTAVIVWLLRCERPVAVREALTSAGFLVSFAVLLVLGASALQPAADRYFMSAAFGFFVVHLLMPFTFRQIVGHAIVSAVALGVSAWQSKSGAAFVSDRLEVLLPATVVLGMLGALMMLHNRRRTYLLERRSRLQADALEEANRAMARLLRQDTLTGVSNRRYFDETMESMWRRMRAAEKSLGVILLDVDRFKHFNDSMGHQAGDQCLKQVAHCLDLAVRDSDRVVARYGGEEFGVVLGDASCADAHAIGDRLRKAVEALGLAHPQGGVVTVSVGVAACVPAEGRGFHALVDAADKALYASKEAGRNRVTAGFLAADAVPDPETWQAATG